MASILTIGIGIFVNNSINHRAIHALHLKTYLRIDVETWMDPFTVTISHDIQVGNATKCRIVYTTNEVASEDGSNPTLDEHRDVDQDAPARKATVAMVECTFRVLRAI
ncbi:hypothetical protein T12_15602 [Trichinella patagoniensis]|uniref:Uncharacterized protein n=1 Tax=Trichinella patagoniensis TaxID=990121 RepID=A0A0V0ZCL9_9BILA|nr:hypothetical protein T12_15602 [Trichinella patagoniensis]